MNTGFANGACKSLKPIYTWSAIKSRIQKKFQVPAKSQEPDSTGNTCSTTLPWIWSLIRPRRMRFNGCGNLFCFQYT